MKVIIKAIVETSEEEEKVYYFFKKFMKENFKEEHFKKSIFEVCGRNKTIKFKEGEECPKTI